MIPSDQLVAGDYEKMLSMQSPGAITPMAIRGGLMSPSLSIHGTALSLTTLTCCESREVQKAWCSTARTQVRVFSALRMKKY